MRFYTYFPIFSLKEENMKEIYFSSLLPRNHGRRPKRLLIGGGKHPLMKLMLLLGCCCFIVDDDYDDDVVVYCGCFPSSYHCLLFF